MSYRPPPSAPYERGAVVPYAAVAVILVLIGFGVLGLAIHKAKKSTPSALAPVTTTTTTASTGASPGPASGTVPGTTTITGGRQTPDTTTTIAGAPSAPGTTIAHSATTTVAGTTRPVTTRPATTTPPVAGSRPGAAPNSLSNTGGPATEAPALALLAGAVVLLRLNPRRRALSGPGTNLGPASRV